jgi:succinate dehydrogenase hydrophobic anchor subunit
MKNKFEKIWTLIVAILLFSVRYIHFIGVDIGWERVTTTMVKYSKGCSMLMLNGCGFVRFSNVLLIILSVAFLGYFVYYNYEKLSIIFKKFLKSIEKK